MDILEVKGGSKLEGTVRSAGAKNAMTKLLVASLLSNKKCIFHNVPNIGDVEITVNLAKRSALRYNGIEKTASLKSSLKN